MNICVKLFEPLYGPVLKYCNKGIRDRMKMVKVANERFENELDIHLLLKKIRAVEGLMRNMLTKQQLKLLKYMKNSVFETKQIDDPTSSEESSKSENEIEVDYEDIGIDDTEIF